MYPKFLTSSIELLNVNVHAQSKIWWVFDELKSDQFPILLLPEPEPMLDRYLTLYGVTRL